MREFSAFDILGPIMIGPSSSHTAGAARLGKVASIIAGEEIVSVNFKLHGSFSKTYKGHGTDKALVAGILGMDPWDERLKDSLNIAKARGIAIAFIKEDLGDVHPNTVKFEMNLKSGSEVVVVGSSVGGGSIIVTNINGEEIEFTGEYPTLIINHRDVPGIVSRVSTILADEGINIAFMKVFRNSKGSLASMVFETDTLVSERVIEKIKNVIYILKIRVINQIQED